MHKPTVLALIWILLPGAALADEYHSYADLVCDSARNIALIRFAGAYNADPPAYAKLPVAVDRGLSKHPGTGRRVCTLSNGWEIKLRNGSEQAFGYGMGGGAPPFFFSLWIDRRKVISHRIWSEQNYSQTQIPIAGVVVTPSRLMTCTLPHGMDKPVACAPAPLALEHFPIDTVEYPTHAKPSPPPGSLVVTAGTDGDVCRAIIQHGPNAKGVQRGQVGEPDLLLPPSEIDWVDEDALAFTTVEPWLNVMNTKVVFGVGEPVQVSFGQWPQDFDGDGARDTVVERTGESHYMDGSYYIVAPEQVPVIEVLRKVFPNPDLDEDDIVKRAHALGWQVYAGGQPGFYPNVSPRYVHIDRFKVGGQNYLYAYPTNEEQQPTAMVIKPRPGGKFDTVCTLQRPRLNY